MALQGFAEGALAGFGAVNKFYDDKRRRDLDQTQIDNLKDYRDETLEGARLDRGLKRERLDADILRNKRLDGISELNAQTALLRAQTAGTTANTAASVEKRAVDSLNDRGETPEQEANRLYREAQTDKITVENDRMSREEMRLQGGVDISRMFDIAQMTGVPTEELQNEFTELVKRNITNPTTFNVKRIISQSEQDAQRHIGDVFANLSRGQFDPLNRSQLDAFGRTFDLDNAAYIGREVKNFPQAPDYLKTDGRKVVGSGLYSADIGAGSQGQPAVSGDMVIWTETPDGDMHPYFPTLTQARNPNGLAVEIDMANEAVPGAAGHAYFANSLSQDSRFVDMLDRALIQDAFGGPGDSGQKTFDERVNAKMALVEKAYANGQDQMLDMQFLLEDGETLQSMYKDNIGVLEARIKDNLLGKREQTTWGREADTWLKENVIELAKFPLPGSVIGTNVGQNKTRRGMVKAQTIGELDVFANFKEGVVADVSEAKMVSRIAFLFETGGGQPRLKKGIGKGQGVDSSGNPDGSDISDEEMLIQVLNSYGAGI